MRAAENSGHVNSQPKREGDPLHELLFHSTNVNHGTNADKTSLANNMMTKDDQFVTGELTF